MGHHCVGIVGINILVGSRFMSEICKLASLIVILSVIKAASELSFSALHHSKLAT